MKKINLFSFPRWMILFWCGLLLLFSLISLKAGPPSGTVTISGTTMQGEVLTASNDLTDADGLGAISYQWKRGGNHISGAQGTTYTLTQADVGAVITVTASYDDDLGNAESLTSSATAVVEALIAGDQSLSTDEDTAVTITLSANIADVFYKC